MGLMCMHTRFLTLSRYSQARLTKTRNNSLVSPHSFVFMRDTCCTMCNRAFAHLLDTFQAFLAIFDFFHGPPIYRLKSGTRRGFAWFRFWQYFFSLFAIFIVGIVFYAPEYPESEFSQREMFLEKKVPKKVGATLYLEKILKKIIFFVFFFAGFMPGFSLCTPNYPKKHVWGMLWCRGGKKSKKMLILKK